jgi:hypothetical protein
VTELPSRSAFAGCVGNTFRIRASEDRAETVTLIEVQELGSSGPREQFSVIFRGGQGDHLPQRIYRMEHEELGLMDLFLVPVGPDDEGMLYQAVFA